MSTEDNKALYLQFLEEVWNKGNVAAVDELIAPNYVDHLWYPTNTPVPVKHQMSLEDYKQFISHWHTTFPDLHSIVELQVAEGDLVVTHFTASGTHKGDFRGLGSTRSIPPTGKQVTWTMTDIVRIADGKIVERWYTDDIVGLLRPLGLVPTLE